MDIRDLNIEALVEQVTREIAKRIEYASASDENVKGTVALYTGFVASRKACAEALRVQFGEGVDGAMFGGTFSAPGFFPFPVESDEDCAALMQKLAGAANVVLVAPKLALLYRLAEGEDEGFVEQAFLRPLLWGRNVYLLLDFAAPKFKRATFFAKVADALDALESMGVKVLSYSPAQEEGEAERLALVTEEHIRGAVAEGKQRLLLTGDAIVTPLARETARDFGIRLDY